MRKESDNELLEGDQSANLSWKCGQLIVAHLRKGIKFLRNKPKAFNGLGHESSGRGIRSRERRSSKLMLEK